MPLFGSMMALETQHTKIIFEAEDEAYAAHLASFADDTFEELSAFLFNRSTKRVPVVLVGDRALPNGYYRSFPSSITLYLTSPADRFLSSRSQDWLRSVYTHELTHYLHLTSRVGLAKPLSLFGPEGPALITAFMPGWWVEGVATWTETSFLEYGGRGDSPAFAQNWQAPLAEGRMWSLGQGAYPSAFAPSSRVYATGYLMIDYLIKGWGRESFDAVNHKFAAFPFFGISPAIKKVTGHSAKELFSLALSAQEQSSRGVQGTFIHPLAEGSRYIVGQSNIGLLGYGSSPTKGGALYRYLDDKEEVILPLSLSGPKALSIGGDKALFAHLWADIQDRSYSDLYLLDLIGRTYHRLTQRAHLVDPAISGNGERAVASQIRGDDYALVSIDLEDGTVTDLAYEVGVSYLDATLNADGSKLLYIALSEGNSSLLYNDGKQTRVLLGPTATDLRSPFFDNEGHVYVIAEFTLWHVDEEGGGVVELLGDAMGVHSATFVDDELYWQTYTSYGDAVKKISRSSLTARPVQLLDPLPALVLPSIPPYIVRPYHDHLRFNLALPYPFVSANKVQPALWFHLSSILGSQTLIGAVGWSIDDASPVADLLYQMLVGPFGLGLSVQHNKAGVSESIATAAIAMPIHLYTNPRTASALRFEVGASALWIGPTYKYALGMVGAGYRVSSSQTRKMDFYGAPTLFASASLQHDLFETMFGFSGGGQIRIPKSSIMLSLGVDLVGSDGLDVSTNLPYYSFTATTASTKLKGRAKAALRVPLPLLDLPIPFGGLTHMGIELQAMQAFSLQQGELAFDPDWAVAATLTLETRLGSSSVPFKPFVQVAYLVEANRWQYTIGLDSQSFFEVITLHSDHGQFAK